MKQLILLVLGFFAISGITLAQSVPEPLPEPGAWRTLVSPHLRVHFRAGLEATAQLAARAGEEAFVKLEQEFGFDPGTITVVLNDESDFSNGDARSFNRVINANTSRFRLSDVLSVRLGWWRQLLFHEFVHVFDMSTTSGPAAVLRGLVGPVIAPNRLRPWATVEGLAVFEKYKLLGESRLNDSGARAVIRQMVLEDRFPKLDLFFASQPSSRDWPDVSTLRYKYGAWFMRFLEAKFGAGAAIKLVKVIGDGENFNFDAALERAFGLGSLGLDSHGLYVAFMAYLKTEFRPEIESIKSRGLSTSTGTSTKLTGLGHELAGLSSDATGRLVYTFSSADRGGLRMLDANGERELIGDRRIRFPSFGSDGKSVIYSKYGARDQLDLYRLDLASNREQRLTSGERAYFARSTKDGQIVYARNTPSGSSLLALRDTNGRSRILRDFAAENAAIHSFAIHPNGQSLALILQTEDGFQDLYRYEIASNKLERLTQNLAQDTDPVFTPDGKQVVFSSDPDRVSNVYALRLEDRAMFRLSDTLGANTHPAIRGGKLAFIGYGPLGNDLFEMPLEPANGQANAQSVNPAINPAIDPLPAPFEMTNFPIGAYNPLENLNLIVLPGLVGLSFDLSDSLQQQRLAFGIRWDPFTQLPGFNLGYALNLAPFTVRASLEGDTQTYDLETLDADWKFSEDDTLGLTYSRLASTVRTRHSLGLTLEGERDWRTEYTQYGLQFGITPQVNIVQGSGATWGSLEASLAGNVSFGWGNRLSLSTHAGISGNDPLGAAFGVGGTNGPYRVRGVPSNALRGNEVLTASLEASQSLLAIQTRLAFVPFVPVFIDDLWITGFADAGWVSQGFTAQGSRFGVGAQLGLSFELLFPLTVSAGLGYGIGESAPVFVFQFGVPAIRF
jgi:Tol biopolymer transport system component